MISNNKENYIEMINISSVKGKEHKMIYIGNYRLNDFKPFKEPSFAKADTLYRIEYFPELEDYISFGGEKLNEIDFNNILLERKRYINKTNNVKVINFT